MERCKAPLHIRPIFSNCSLESSGAFFRSSISRAMICTSLRTGPRWLSMQFFMKGRAGIAGYLCPVDVTPCARPKFSVLASSTKEMSPFTAGVSCVFDFLVLCFLFVSTHPTLITVSRRFSEPLQALRRRSIKSFSELCIPET